MTACGAAVYAGCGGCETGIEALRAHPWRRCTGAPPRTARSPRAAQPSRKEQGERARRAILDAAIAFYAEAGVRGTGLIAIGKRAGVHHATVLYHFKSSRELLLAVLQERDRLFLEYSRDALDRGGLEALRLLPFTGRFNNVGSPLDPRNTDVVAAYRRFTDILTGDLVRGLARGRVKG